MKCSNCGKEIPFVGNVCPWCHTNKQGDQMVMVAAVLGGIIGAVVGFGGLGALGVDSTGWKIGVMFGFMIAAAIFATKAKDDFERKQTAAKQQMPPAGSTTVKCPHCAEQIQPDAKICRFCQRDVAA